MQIHEHDLVDSCNFSIIDPLPFGTHSFAACEIVHHPLIRADDGQKLSKSLQSAALRNIRESGEKPTVIYRKVAEFFGYEASSIHGLNDLVERVSG